MALVGDKGDCDLICEGCEKENDPEWCLLKMVEEMRKITTQCLKKMAERFNGKT